MSKGFLIYWYIIRQPPTKPRSENGMNVKKNGHKKTSLPSIISIVDRESLGQSLFT